jgi:hypothetical protein
MRELDQRKKRYHEEFCGQLFCQGSAKRKFKVLSSEISPTKPYYVKVAMQIRR